MRLEAKHRGVRWGRVLILLCALVGAAAIDACLAADRSTGQSNPQVGLTDAERAWIRQHPRIRVQNETNRPPFNFAEGGQPQGYSIDFMNLLARRVGLQVEYVAGPSWDEFLAMMKRDELDVMLNIVRTPEREQYLRFTPACARNPSILVSRSGTPYSGLEQLAGKTIAVPKGFFYEEILRRDFPQVKLLSVSDAPAAMEAVTRNEADAAISERAVFNYLTANRAFANLRASLELNLWDPELALTRIAVRRDEPMLASILAKGIDAIGPGERRILEQKWLGSDTAFEVPWSQAHLTDEELAWLDRHRDIRLGVHSDYPPFESTDDKGAYTGMAADYVALITKRLGVVMHPVPGLAWGEVLDGVKQDRVDALPAVSPLLVREGFLNFSDKYLTFPVVIITRDGHPLIAGLSDLQGQTLAMVANFATTTVIKRNYPGIIIRESENPLETLRAVAAGEADATVLNLGTASFLIAQHNLKGLVVAAQSGIEANGLAIGVREDWPELIPILNKVLASVTPEEDAVIRNKWIAAPYDARLAATRTRELLTQLAAGAALISILVFSWVVLLKRQIKQRRRAEQLVKEKEIELRDIFERSPVSIVLTRLDGTFLYANPSWLNLLGLTKEDLVQRRAQDDYVDPAEHEKVIQILKKDGWVRDLEIRCKRRDGQTIWTLLSADLREYQKEICLISWFVDITARKTAEQTLSSAEELLRMALDAMSDGLYMVDKHLNVQIVNQKYRYYLDYPDGVMERGQPLRESMQYRARRGDYGPGDPAVLLEQRIAALRSGSLTRLEDSVCGRILDTRRAPTADGGFVTVVRDVTEQKQAERALDDQLVYQRALLDTVPTPIYIKGKDARFIGCNLAYEQVFRTSREELVGKTVYDLPHIPPEMCEAVYQRDQEILRTGKPVFSAERLPFGDGPRDTLFWINRFNLADGSVGGLVGAIVDVSEQKALERQAKEAEQRLREIADAVPGVVYQLRVERDGSRSYAFMSDAVTSLRGFSREEALADYALLFRQVVDEDKAIIDRAIRISIETLAPMQEEFRIVMPDGTIKWLQSAAVPSRAADGAVVLNGYWIDVTQHRDMELQLAAAKAAADAANRAKSSFLAAMSHEIRTPMNGVLGMLELLSLTRLDGEQRANVEVIRESGRSLLRIINDILDFSKIEAGMLDLNPEPSSIADVVRGVTEIYSGAASGKNLLLSAKVDPHISPAVMVDPLRLRQILNNFVSNALKFTSSGSVTITAELIDRKDGADTVSFAVTDTGIGISAENQKKLFQPFVQAEGDTTRRFGGSGLGLVICRRIADLMDGTIELESEVGRGTTMRLVVPLPQADPSQIRRGDETASFGSVAAYSRRPAPDIDVAIAEGTLVLVADDHPINRLLIKRQLSSLGYACETVEDGKQALDAWRSGRYGLVITDCHMPEMDGYELTRLIRDAERQKGGPHTPVLACTANVLEGEAEACLAAGMDGYVAKPVELAALLAALNRWLPLADGATGPARTERPDAADPTAVAEPGPIDRAKLAEMSMGDADFEREMLADFRGSADADAEQLSVALEASDCDAVVRIAHRIKGASRAVGAVPLADISEQMEKAGRAHDLAAIAAAREPLFHEIERLRKHLAAL